MGTAAVSKLGAEVLDEAAPWLYRSFQGELAKTETGKVLLDGIRNMYEPLSKKMTNDLSTPIQKELSQVPEHLHTDVSRTITSGVPHVNPTVDKAANNIKKIYHNQKTTKPVLFNQAAKGNEAVKWHEWADNYSKQYARETVFGKNNEHLIAVVKGAYQETGRRTYADNIADGLSTYFHEEQSNWRNAVRKGVGKVNIDARSPYYATGEFEKAVKSTTSAMLTGRVAVPHSLQAIVNGILTKGVTNTTRAISAVFSDPQLMKQRVAMSGAMVDQMYHELIEASKKDGAGRLKKFYLDIKQPGLNFVRKWNIITSGIGGKFAAQEYAEDLLNGKNIEAAKINLKYFGIDPAEVVLNKGLSAEHEDKAIFRSVQEDMFNRGGLQTPPKWDQSSMSRVMFMYKQYAYNEGRLIVDTFKRSASIYKTSGDIKPLLKTMATVGIIFPLAGEATKIVMNLITGHNATQTDKLTGNRYVDEYIEAMGHVAGFGIAYSMFRSASRRMLANALIGPVFGSAVDLTQDMATGNYHQLTRDIGNKMGVAGPLVTNKLLPPKKKGKQGGFGLSIGLGKL